MIKKNQFIFLFLLFVISLSAKEFENRIYVPTADIESFGFDPQKHQDFWIIQYPQIHEFGFECTGPGCNDMEPVHDIDIIKNKINKNIFKVYYKKQNRYVLKFYNKLHDGRIDYCGISSSSNKPLCAANGDLTPVPLDKEGAFIRRYHLEKYINRKTGLRTTNSSYYTATTRLRLRRGPSTSTPKVASVGKNEKVEFLEDSGKSETIDKRQGKWLKVKTKKGKVGYLFGGYLKPVE